MNNWWQSVLHPAGPDAQIIAQLAWALFIGAAIIFAGVIVAAALGLRRRSSNIRPMRWILGAGVVFPIVTLSALLGWSSWRAGQLTAQTSNQALRVSVIGHMWWWEVRYHDPASGREIVTANEIRMPTGRPVYLGISSADVIHSVWIPALHGKVDAVPGRINGLTQQAAATGLYRGQCAEYCGVQHAHMALHVVALEPAAFDRWLAQQAADAAPPATPMLARGRLAFQNNGCAACHTIRGVSDGAHHGPDLTHVGSRLYIGAGTLRTHRGTLAGWIADPHSSKPGVRMPAASGMDGEAVRLLATYLESLK